MLTSPIVDYDSNWPCKFERAVQELATVFDCSLSQFHHIGSTAVPGLAAKPEIDILAVIDAPQGKVDWSHRLQGYGYRRGADLSVGHQFYKRDVDGLRTHKLHLCIAGHQQIAWMIGFRDLLLRDASIRSEYQILKKRLESLNTGGIAEYLEHKDPFIREAMDRANS